MHITTVNTFVAVQGGTFGMHPLKTVKRICVQLVLILACVFCAVVPEPSKFVHNIFGHKLPVWERAVYCACLF